MKGSLHGIWFTNSGSIHPAIKEFSPRWAKHLEGCGFKVVFWTNKEQVNEDIITFLEENNVIVNDYSLCQLSQLYPYFDYFYQKGRAGDTVAFALASDVLRMAILDITDPSEYYIYADPNDTEFFNLKESIDELPFKFRYNSLGFAFPIHFYQDPESPAYKLDIRNDVLIALKQNNPQFFQDFFQAYRDHLEKNYQNYKKPNSDKEALHYANTITHCAYEVFFKVTYSRLAPTQTIKSTATFGPYQERWAYIYTRSFLKYARYFSCADTWLPVDKNIDGETLQKSLRMPIKTFDYEQPTISDQMVWISTEISSEFSRDILFKTSPDLLKFFKAAGLINEENKVLSQAVNCNEPSSQNP